MYKLRSISKTEFENYIKKQENTHFMYSTAWGEFEKVTNENLNSSQQDPSNTVGLFLILVDGLIRKIYKLFILCIKLS